MGKTNQIYQFEEFHHVTNQEIDPSHLLCDACSRAAEGNLTPKGTDVLKSLTHFNNQLLNY